MEIYKKGTYEKLYQPNSVRNSIWKGICSYIQKEISPRSTVLDLGCGYCNFINNINAQKKIAVDIDKGYRDYAEASVNFVHSSCTELKPIKDDTIDIVFSSNLLEHLSLEDVEETISQIQRILRKKGKLILIQPNFYYSYKEYFHDFTHRTIFTHVSLSDLLECYNFKVKKVIPKFLPFSLNKKYSGLSIPHILIHEIIVQLYLSLPIRPLAKQMYMIAEKNER